MAKKPAIETKRPDHATRPCDSTTRFERATEAYLHHREDPSLTNKNSANTPRTEIDIKENSADLAERSRRSDESTLPDGRTASLPKRGCRCANGTDASTPLAAKPRASFVTCIWPDSRFTSLSSDAADTLVSASGTVDRRQCIIEWLIPSSSVQKTVRRAQNATQTHVLCQRTFRGETCPVMLV